MPIFNVHIAKQQATKTNNNELSSSNKNKDIMIAKYLLSPSSNINYDFISSIYGLFALLSVLLYTLETQVFINYIGQGDEGSSATMKELAESTKGLYLIFVPFLPSLLWSLVIRNQWKKSLVNGGNSGGSDGKQKDE